MRKVAIVFTALAALSFLGGTSRAFFGSYLFGMGKLGIQPETYWRGATGLLLFAIVLLMLERPRPQ